MYTDDLERTSWVNENPEATNPDAEDRPQRERKVKKRRQRAYMMTRSPFDLTPLKVYDDQMPDDVILKYCGEGNDKWLEKNNPELAQWIHALYLKTLEDDVKDKIKRKKITRKKRDD